MLENHTDGFRKGRYIDNINVNVNIVPLGLRQYRYVILEKKTRHMALLCIQTEMNVNGLNQKQPEAEWVFGYVKVNKGFQWIKKYC